MKIAITGGTGFVGRHLARALSSSGHEVVLIARGVDRRDESVLSLQHTTLVQTSVADEQQLTKALQGCDAVAHCAGINRQIGAQTYQAIHVEGTLNVVNAAARAGAKKVVLLSFLRARPNCGSPYHESKWAAEEIVRNSGLDYTIVKAGMIYGRGDHMLDHLSHLIHTIPLFVAVGLRERPIRPLAIDDLVDILVAALVEGRLTRQTIAATGPEQITLSEAASRIARLNDKRLVFLKAPVWVHRLLAVFFELIMKVPLASLAQVRILGEGVVEPAPPCRTLPADLAPRRPFSEGQILCGLPAPGPFTVKDLRFVG